VLAQALGAGNWQVIAVIPPPINYLDSATSYTISGNDCGNTIKFGAAVTSPIAVSVPHAQVTSVPATNFPNGCAIRIQNIATAPAILTYLSGSTVSGTYGTITLASATQSLLAPGVTYTLTVVAGQWQISDAEFNPGVVIVTSTVSGASFREDLAFLSGYNAYTVVLEHWGSSTSPTGMSVQYVTGGTIGIPGSIQSGANYNYQYGGPNNAGVMQAAAVSAQTSIVLIGGWLYSGNDGLNLQIKMVNPASATYKSITTSGGVWLSTYYSSVIGSGSNTTITAAVTGLAFTPGAGTLSGTYRVIGAY
jgi:hypothetical protein